jgi:hypothetical protein
LEKATDDIGIIAMEPANGRCWARLAFRNLQLFGDSKDDSAELENSHSLTRISNTYALLPVATKNTFSMWKSCNCIWPMITSGDQTSVAARDAPNNPPAVTVDKTFDAIFA